MSGVNWGDTDWQEGEREVRRGYGTGGGGREFSQSQLFSNWVEWLRGIGRSWVFCASGWNILAIQLKPHVFIVFSVCFYSYSDPASLEQSLSSLSLSLFTSFHLSISPSVFVQYIIGLVIKPSNLSRLRTWNWSFRQSFSIIPQKKQK